MICGKMTHSSCAKLAPFRIPKMSGLVKHDMTAPLRFGHLGFRLHQGCGCPLWQLQHAKAGLQIARACYAHLGPRAAPFSEACLREVSEEDMVNMYAFGHECACAGLGLRTLFISPTLQNVV